VQLHYKGKWEGVGPWKSILFWALWHGIVPLGECHLGPKKVEISRAQHPPICPSNGFARIKPITTGQYQSEVHIGSFTLLSLPNSSRKSFQYFLPFRRFSILYNKMTSPPVQTALPELGPTRYNSKTTAFQSSACLSETLQHSSAPTWSIFLIFYCLSNNKKCTMS
jgi:hypothetical protein